MDWNSNIGVLKDYFERICITSFEMLSLDVIRSAFDDRQVEKRLVSFAAGECSSIAIRLKDELKLNGSESRLEIVDVSELTRPINSCCIVYKKSGSVLSTRMRLAVQLCVINLSDEDLIELSKTSDNVVENHANDGINEVEIIRSYLKSTLSPLLHSFHANKPEGDYSALTKCVTELDTELMYYEQSISIPEVHISFPPFLVEAADRCRAANQVLTSSEVGWGDKPNNDMLNELLSLKGQWIKEVHKLIDYQRDVKQGTTLQEVNFWLVFQSYLKKVSLILDSYEVQLVFSTLKSNNLIVSAGAIEVVTDLRLKLNSVNSNVEFLNGIPINSILACNDIDTLNGLISKIFTQLKKIKNMKDYGLPRMVDLVDSISLDVANRVSQILSSQHLLDYDYSDFQRILKDTGMVYLSWKNETVVLWQYIREKGIKRPGGSTIKLELPNTSLQERLKKVQAFRDDHERYTTSLKQIFSSEERDAFLIKMAAAYERFRLVNVCDLSESAINTWERLMKEYISALDEIDQRVIDIISSKFSECHSTEQCFNVFNKYNELFFRPCIQVAFQRYQSTLLEDIKKDITRLDDLLLNQAYPDSDVYQYHRAHDIPKVAGSIMWAKQIKHQLDVYLYRIKVVLGSEWDSHQEGRLLKSKSETMISRLDYDRIVKQWIESMDKEKSKQMHTKEVFSITYRPAAGYVITLNYDEEYMSMFKEFRTMNWLRVYPPASIRATGETIKPCYVCAMHLKSALFIYTKLLSQTDREVLDLTYESLQEVRGFIAKAYNEKLTWQSIKLKDFTNGFTRAVYMLQDGISEISKHVHNLNEMKLELKRCDYSAEGFASVLSTIQSIMNELSSLKCFNLDVFIMQIDKEIEGILQTRMNNAIMSWICGFKHHLTGSENHATLEEIEEEREKCKEGFIYDSALNMEINHSIQVVAHGLSVLPPIEDTKMRWMNSFLGILSTVTSLPRLKCTQDLFVSAKDQLTEETRSYASLIELANTDQVKEGLLCIQTLYLNVATFVSSWLSNQSIWRISTKDIADKLGSQLEPWQRLLRGIITSRSEVSSETVEKVIGCVHINLEKVQSNIAKRYDAIHKDLLQTFGGVVFDEAESFVKELLTAKELLEKYTVSASTHETISLILITRDVNTSLPTWNQRMERIESCQSLLSEQGYEYPSNWIYMEQILNDWESVKRILQRREEVIKQSQEQLKKSIIDEDNKIRRVLSEVSDEWEKKKPLSGKEDGKEALQTIQFFSDKFSSLSDKWGKVNKGRDALGLDVYLENPIEVILIELNGLREAWSAVSAYWEKLNTLGSTLWSNVNMKRYNEDLGVLEKEIEEIDVGVKQYSCYSYLQTKIREYHKQYSIINELKTSSLKERHWNSILTILHISTSYEFLHIIDFWTHLDGEKVEAIKDVLLVSQGELAIEEYIKQIREFWDNCELELVSYQNRCKLIRGWESIFQKLDEHLSSLNSMKQSPYYKEFTDEAKKWEDRITSIRLIFDTWIDVQRKWVYLEGIFNSGADIVQQLPMIYRQFTSVDNTFISLMRKVALQPRVMDVFSIPNIQRSLETISQSLNKIQKALGEYLDKQRQAFSRFYFVGDEDLLEIVGNSKDPVKVQRHLSKMFAGINGLDMVSEGDHIYLTSMVSKEGEIVPLSRRIAVTESIVTWLTEVEATMHETLASLLDQAVSVILSMDFTSPTFLDWIKQFPSQIIILSIQIVWCNRVENGLKSAQCEQLLKGVVDGLDSGLRVLADRVLQPLPVQERKKYEQLITEFVYEKNTTQSLIEKNVRSIKDFRWQYSLRAYYDDKQSELLKKLVISIGDASFYYGYEYLGVCERLVQTPLTDRCYLTLAQALRMGLGGNPFGPAGTGKTESVKMLAALLGRFCLVFNCDEAFDFQAMGRIFRGLCQVGAWGCFDEFNRLEERILSAVSQQIWTIQTGLRDQRKEIMLLERPVHLHPNVGIFVTMNPGYAGRSNLPDNLKQLFRSIAMIKSDWEMIARVILFSQGFRASELLAGKIVTLFTLCQDQLSSQSHYDFGLRALKSVVVNAGIMKRKRYDEEASLASMNEEDQERFEREVLISSICDTMIPKLVAEDLPLLRGLLSNVFTGASLKQIEASQLQAMIKEVCVANQLRPTDSFVDKALQVYSVQDLRHGIMLVGPSGSGKSSVLRCLLEALERVDNKQGVLYSIDPKAIKKEQLFGLLDSTTNEWTDGVFTRIIRQIYNDVRGESTRRHWIVFDGDVDPEWAENLNSVLDDNKLLTLPTGDRLSLPPNVRIFFEVQNLKYATPASVSRCGTVWFSDSTVTPSDMLYNTLLHLRKDPVLHDIDKKHLMALQNAVCDLLEPHFDSQGVVENCLAWSMSHRHIMGVTIVELIRSFHSLLQQIVIDVLEYNLEHSEKPMQGNHFTDYVSNRLVDAMLWGFGGSLVGSERLELCEVIREKASFQLPKENTALINYYVSTHDGLWHSWMERVPSTSIDSSSVLDTSVVIPTIDTIRNQHVMKAYLSTRVPVILCGPPGSGKTMTLTNTLKGMSGFDVVSVNFSSSTSTSLIMKIFDQYGHYSKTPSGMVLQPANPEKWLIIFCDEVNLPEEDKYGTQRVITFLRQIIEQKGFWNTKEHCWVHVENILFVGACNPPTDPGRVPLSSRFLSHVPVLYVDYPEQQSLMQIYSTFNQALLRDKPSVRSMYSSLTEAMVAFYEKNKQHFTIEQQPHYVYSPRELSRWVRALYSALYSEHDISEDELIRLAAHEGQRLFYDRLVTKEEKEWCEQVLDEVFMNVFARASHSVLQRPILYSSWFDYRYHSIDRESLRQYLESKLKVFNEEELNVPLVLFDDVLDHVLRIDRVLKQSLGHLLLVGESGAGKTVLSRFVAWMNNMTVFTIKVSRKYSLENFDDDLRQVMRLAGINGEQICFIFDESNILSTGFLERMNALLASGEVPGLYEGDEMVSLMSACKEASMQAGIMMETAEDVFKWFTSRVQSNLHVVFTMNPANGDFRDRSASSPALFNRCVVDWFGSWGRDALMQVSQYFIRSLDLDSIGYSASAAAQSLVSKSRGNATKERVTLHDAVTACFLFIHQGIAKLDEEKAHDNHCYCSPRDYMDFIHQYLNLFNSKRDELEDQQQHLVVGLEKLKETEAQVRVLKEQVQQKQRDLNDANVAARKKLTQIMDKKEEAQQNQGKSENLAAEIKKQVSDITTKRDMVNKELSRVEPLLREARESVKNINKTILNELRTLVTPPSPIKLTIQAVCCLIGEDSSSWKAIQRVMRRDDFVSTIVRFEANQITAAGAQQAASILATPGLTEESVDRASRVCGPLYRWVKSQLEYNSIYKMVKPLTDEMQYLTDQSGHLRRQQEEVEQCLQELNKEIDGYTEEYGILTQKCNEISDSIKIVTQKSLRSTNLLESLESEQRRWRESCEDYKREESLMIGDCLLGASFVTYGGFFDQHHRNLLVSEWKRLLQDLCIPYNAFFDCSAYLSSSKDRLVWQSHGLSLDELCIQNAIILNRFNRYPLLIDPSGQGISFLSSLYQSSHVTKTSFLDKNFMKELESALRFGSTLIVQDVDYADPVLNPLLNKEFHKEGGRTLIRIGDQEIDFSPSFKLFLSTRDSSHQFSPDLCSRITFVNFTMTTSSLQDQCMSIILQKQAPLIYEKRNHQLQLQGEFQARLRDLEEQLLLSLNGLRGNILDDDTVMNNLEILKTEARKINEDMNQSNVTMQSIQESSLIYQPLSLACSQIFFILEDLSKVLFLYRYNLSFFLDILNDILNLPVDTALPSSKRVTLLLLVLFKTTYARISRGLRHLDARVFALRMCQLYVQSTPNEADPDELAVLLHGVATRSEPTAQKVVNAVFNGVLSEETEALLVHHLSLDRVGVVKKHMVSKPSFWVGTFLNSPMEQLTGVINELGESGWSRGRCLWRWLLLIKELRPDLLINAIEFVVCELVSPDFFACESYDMKEVITEESHSSVPILLCSMPGYDASKKIEQLYQELSLPLNTIAMGNTESYSEAEQLITRSASTGQVVLLRNIHLCPEWLSSLEKLLFSLQPHANFRLYMTSEVHPKLPPSLLRLCYTFVFETPTGIRASLKHSLNALSKSAMNAKPVERCRVHFLLLWLHAVIEERLRYVPVGWTKSYEFSESDLKCSLSVINSIIEDISRGLSHIDINQLNWEAIRTLLSDSIYGGRIDNVFDDELLHAMVRRLFVPEAFNSRFPLVEHYREDGQREVLLTSPEGTSKEDIELWVNHLPVYNSPVWLGLPATAEERLLASQGNYILRNVLAIQESDEREDAKMDEKSATTTPSWLASVLASSLEWIKPLLFDIHPLAAGREITKSSIFNYLNREIEEMRGLQKVVVDDLKSVIGVCRDRWEMTQQIHTLMKCISEDRIPERWKEGYTHPSNQLCSQWVQDFSLRCRHIYDISQMGVDAICKKGVWLGGLLHPEGFITAMKQYVAEKNQMSLDKIRLTLIPINASNEKETKELIETKEVFVIFGLILEGADWENGRLIPSDEIRCQFNQTVVVWSCGEEKSDSTVSIPLYLNETRSDLLYTVDMECLQAIPTDVWKQKSVSLVAWRQGAIG